MKGGVYRNKQEHMKIKTLKGDALYVTPLVRLAVAVHNRNTTAASLHITKNLIHYQKTI